MKILEERNSTYNGALKVVRSFGLGTYIQADGLTQSGGIVETIWKSTLKKISNRDIQKVLILGLGGGTLVKLLNKFFHGVEITGIDIDSEIVNLGKKYLGLNKYKTNILIKDALKFENNEKHDLIIVDTYNGDKYPLGFEDTKFVSKLKSWLEKDGIVIFNRLYFGDKRPEAVKFGNKLEKIFSKVTWYYPQANLMFICKDN